MPDHQMTRSPSKALIAKRQQVRGVQESRRIHGERHHVVRDDPGSTAACGTGAVITKEDEAEPAPGSRAPRLVITGQDHTAMFPLDHRCGVNAKRRGDPRRF